MWKGVLVIVGCLAVAPVAFAEGPEYSAKPIRGIVVDARTGTPLERVIVVAQWILVNRGPGKQWELLQSFETVTDRDGRYAFPGWGPKSSPSPLHILGEQDPVLTFFKPGYKPLSLGNTQKQTTGERVSEWDGKTITLERFREDFEECLALFVWYRLLKEGASTLDLTSSPRLVQALDSAEKKACAGGPRMYSAKPIQGSVVDAETGAPLEGVIVVAQWILFVVGPGHGQHRDRLEVLETVTDRHGHYVFPGWGPKRAKSVLHVLLTKDPEISFFKPGYRPLTVENRRERNDMVRFSEWDGKTMKLERFGGTDEEWARELSLLQGTLAWGWGVVDWRLQPRMTLALELERLILEKKPLKGSNISGLSSLGATIEEVRRFLEGQK